MMFTANVKVLLETGAILDYPVYTVDTEICEF